MYFAKLLALLLTIYFTYINKCKVILLFAYKINLLIK